MNRLKKKEESNLRRGMLYLPIIGKESPRENVDISFRTCGVLTPA
jgi:hypothetical protein